MASTEHDDRHELGPLTRRLDTLWCEVRTQGSPAALASTLEELDRAHRQLVKLEATPPTTAAAGRGRRLFLESLQTETRELERALAAVSADATRLEALARRHLEAAAEARDTVASPPLPRLDCRDHQASLLVVGVLLALAATAFAVHEGLGIALALLSMAAWASGTRRLEFDGRSLHITTRVIGLACWRPEVVDLATSGEVELQEYVSRADPGTDSPWGCVIFSAPDTRVVLIGHFDGESRRVAQTLRKWSASAVQGVLRLTERPMDERREVRSSVGWPQARGVELA